MGLKNSMMQYTGQKIYSNNGNYAVIGNIKGDSKKVLDIGCGNGDNAKFLKASNHIVDGITLSPTEAENAKKYLRAVFIHNLEQGLPDDIVDKYDYIVCSHVIEHIAYPEKLLKDIKSALKDDGRLIVALPNVMNYRFRWELLKGNFPFEESGIWDYTHLRWYTFKSGEEMLIRNNFQIEKASVDGDIPLLSILGFIPKSVRQKIYTFLTYLSSGFFGGQLIYVARK